MATAALERSNRSLSGLDDNDKPTFTAPAYDVMAPRWKLCADVMLGAEAVRADENLDTYFPKAPAETDDERLARVNRAEFFPMFKETVKGLVGLVLRKDPALGEDVPQRLVNLCENIDGSGTALAVFAKRLFTEGLVKGHAGILIDVPKVSSTRPLTIAEEARLGLRPYWVQIKPEQIINWRTQTINGTTILTLLVLSEVVSAPSGAYGTVETTRYRVFRRDPASGVIQYEVWTQGEEQDDPEFEDEGVLKGVSIIPFVAFYGGERIAPLQSIPPLLDLAYTNIAHVQVLSDHRTSLQAAGNPILVIKGRVGADRRPDPNRPVVENDAYFTDGPGAGAKPDDAIITGPNMGIEVEKDGDVHYAEHAGTALGASSKELTDIETRGAAQGLAMLQRDTRAAQTAETERLQRSEKDASLASAARSLQDCLEIALAITATFMGLPTGGSVAIDREFEQTIIDTARFATLSQAVTAGNLSRLTFWTLLVKGGVLPDDFDPEAEQERLDNQSGVSLIGFGGGGGAGERPPGGQPTTSAEEDIGSGNGGDGGSE